MQEENREAHAAIGKRIDRMGEGLSEKMDSMAEDVAKISVIEAEVRQINRNVLDLMDR